MVKFSGSEGAFPPGGEPSAPLYLMYEASFAALNPARLMAEAAGSWFRSPLNPLSVTPFGRQMAALTDVFERATRRYEKPDFRIAATLTPAGETVEVRQTTVWEQPFCRLVHFERVEMPADPLPRVLLIAPMSGHYATLLRGTVEAMLPEHDVFVTDWRDARLVPLGDGSFDLSSYIDYLTEMLAWFGGDCHVIAVCQPGVPALAAVARMEEDGHPAVPRSLVLIGGPIDTRINPTQVNELAKQRGTEWFAENVIATVPYPHPGMQRRVFPGFLQLSGFVGMNFDRHMSAQFDYFRDLVAGDGDGTDKHREFYDEYLAVMDLTAEFYLETVDTVFVRHALPRGAMSYRGRPVDCSAISRTALMTVEGVRDDISGIGQTRAAHDLCSNIPDSRRAHHLQEGVGHYGIFNGARFRSEIAPRIASFIRAA